MGDPLRNRCAWVSTGERCRYVGVWTSDTHGGGGKFYCRAHSISDRQESPIEHGEQVSVQSRLDVGADFDWSSEACRYRSKVASMQQGKVGELQLEAPRESADEILDDIPF